jgi:hypothetical protein
MNLYELGLKSLTDIAGLSYRLEYLADTLEVSRSVSEDMRTAAAELRALRAIVISVRVGG